MINIYNLSVAHVCAIITILLGLFIIVCKILAIVMVSTNNKQIMQYINQVTNDSYEKSMMNSSAVFEHVDDKINALSSIIDDMADDHDYMLRHFKLKCKRKTGKRNTICRKNRRVKKLYQQHEDMLDD